MHPEYDSISLLKEYKREVRRFINGDSDVYPPFPENYFSLQKQAILNEYKYTVIKSKRQGSPVLEFPEAMISQELDNTWHDTAEAIINNWIGQVYQVTSVDRKQPFKEFIDPDDPLGMKN